MRLRFVGTFLAVLALVVGCAEGERVAPTSPDGTALLDGGTCEPGLSGPAAEAMLARLAAAVDRVAEEGALNRGQSRALAGHLAAIGAHLDTGRPCPAHARIGAYREQVGEFREAGVINDRQMAWLLEGTRLLRDGAALAEGGVEAHAPGVSGEVRTVTLDGHEVTYEVIDGLAILQSDIILGYADEVEAWTQTGGPALTGVCPHVHLICDPWTDGVVGWDFANGTGDWGDAETNQAMRNRIEDAIAHWEAQTGLRFERRTTGERLVFRNGGGCSSWIGRQVLTGFDPQWITVSTRCDRGRIIHEIGHAVGLFHEQSRDDRDDWVGIDLSAVPLERHHNFFHYWPLGRDVGEYDYGSIMHYGCGAFVPDHVEANSVWPTRAPATCADIGQRDRLSEGDILGVYTLYPPDFTIVGGGSSEPGWRFDLEAVFTGKPVKEGYIVWSSPRVPGDLGTGSILSIRAGDLPEGSHVITARVEIHGEVVLARSTSIVVFDPSPSISITNPSSGASHARWTEPVRFEADLDLHPDALPEVTWTSDIDGHFRTTGGITSFQYQSLSLGTHTITAVVQDHTHDLSGSDAIQLTITNQPPAVAIVRPVDGSVWCTDERISFLAQADDPNHPDIVYPSGSFEWDFSPRGILRDGAGFTLAFEEAGTQQVTLLFQDRGGMIADDQVQIHVQECEVPPLSVRILEPWGDAELTFDAQDPDTGLWYADLTLRGIFLGGQEPLPGEWLTWTTNRADLQDPVLGTGEELSVRLHSDHCSGDMHEITLSGTVPEGGAVRTDVRQVWISTVC